MPDLQERVQPVQWEEGETQQDQLSAEKWKRGVEYSLDIESHLPDALDQAK